jgi:hypothetical protein
MFFSGKERTRILLTKAQSPEYKATRAGVTTPTPSCFTIYGIQLASKKKDQSDVYKSRLRLLFTGMLYRGFTVKEFVSDIL